jgi:tetratricopeptide (TPR) repeat protein
MRALTAICFAVAYLFAVPALADKDADAYYKEGLAYKQEGKIDQAIKSLEQAVANNPKHGMAWASLGSLYKQKKDLAKSIDAYEHATQVITKDAVIWMNLGTAYANSDPARLDDAERALTTACHLAPKDPEVRAKLGTVKSKKGDYAGAIAELEIAVKLKADESDWWNNLGVAYRKAKRDDDAIKAYEKAIALNPNDADYHFSLGAAYRRKDDADKAIPEYEKATSLDPTNRDGWFDLGFMYKKNHENDKAIDAWNHYLCLKPDTDGSKRINEEMAGIGGKAECKGGAKSPDKPKPKTRPKKK